MDKVKGTSCIICEFTKDSKAEEVKPEELNKNGGIITTDKKELARQKSADVITMPGAKHPIAKKWCNNKGVDQYVTECMCCDLWDAPGVLTTEKE